MPRLLVLVLLMVTTAMPPAGQTLSLPPGGTFLDDDRLAAEPFIEALVASRITNGCGSKVFCPDQPVTRGQMAVFLVKALGLEPNDPSTSSGAARFSDLDPILFYTASVTRLAELGMVAGYPDGTYRPNQPVTRAEMAAFLTRAAMLTPASPGTVFSDVTSTDWFAPFVETLRVNGITNGCAADRYCPDQPVLRQHMAFFLVRTFHLTPLTPPMRYGPLNGLPVTNGFVTNRRVVAVKIDNVAGARPQSGLERADAVMELPVEGGLTRLIGLFHQTDAVYVGPVRSARPTDAVLKSLGATMAISGAQPWIADQVAAEGVPIIREGQVVPPVMFRINTRVPPYNLYTNTIALRSEASRRGYPDPAPPDLFSFGPFQYGSAALASDITVSWSDPISVRWHWDGTRYVRSIASGPHLWQDQAGNTGPVGAATLVVILGTRFEVSPPTGIVGSVVPAVMTIGSGRMLMFSNGRVVEGTWTRPDSGVWFNFEVAGSELVVPPGVPWISILPDDRTVTWS